MQRGLVGRDGNERVGRGDGQIEDDGLIDAAPQLSDARAVAHRIHPNQCTLRRATSEQESPGTLILVDLPFRWPWLAILRRS